MGEETNLTTTDTEIDKYVEEEGEEEAAEGNEANEEKKKRQTRKDEAKEREKQLELLQKYLDSLAYKMPEKQYKTSAHIDLLAKPPDHRFVSLYEEYGSILKPKGRAKRIERKAKDVQVITTEQLHGYIQQHEERQAIKTKANEQREKIFYDILQKLEKQCHEQLMKELITKFAKFMSNICANYKPPPIMTESAQRLTRGLVCNMYLSLDIKQRPCNTDQSLYETIGLVLNHFITAAIIAIQTPKINNNTNTNTDENIRPKCFERKPKSHEPQEDDIPKFQCHEEIQKPEKKKPKKMKKMPKLPSDFQRFLHLSTKGCRDCNEPHINH